MKLHLLSFMVLLSSGIFAQNFWSTTKLNQKELKQSKKVAPQDKLYTLDTGAMLDYLSIAPKRINNEIQSDLIIEIPNLEGKLERFYVAEASNFSEALQAQFPNIRSYRGISLDNPAIQISFSISPNGVSSMRMEAGRKSTFIETITQDNTVYKVFEKSSKPGDWSCDTPEEHMDHSLTNRFGDELTHRDADDQKLRNFRLALSCTAEYTQFFGGTVAGALAGMNATMSRVNPIFERDFALNMTIISNNASIIYTDASTDPYSPASTGTQGAWNSELQANLTSTIGEANYDIGHLFGASGGGGHAGCIGCVCGPGKGSAYTSPSNNVPEGDTFDIDYVIHEMGHQLGANHTFVRSEGTGVNFEPGSGSTIMAYAGIVQPSSANVQANSDAYFHWGSIFQVTANVKTKTCPTETAISNQQPTVDAGADYTIPVGTPFILTGSGSDPDGDTVTFNWEQTDTSSANSFITVNPNSTTGPLVRSITPTPSPVRYIPSFDKVIAGNLFSPFESLSNVPRNINFALQARDNHAGIGQTNSDKMVVQTVGDAPFKITSPANESSIRSGQTVELIWDVANTNQSPVNVSNVDVLLSTDGGNNFTTIAEGIANDGTETITIPENSSSENGAYIMIKSVGNIFYTVGKVYIDYTVSTECFDYAATGLPLAIPDGTGQNQFGEFAVAAYQVPDIGNIDEVRVAVDITHPYVGDLQVVVQAPNAQAFLVLWNRSCASSDNINATFTDNGSAVNCSSITGDIVPANPLSTYSGWASQGNWLIGVRDGYNQDTGTINSSTLTLCKQATTPMGTSDIVSNESKIQIYPNPSSGIFNISMDLKEKGVKLNVFDVVGRKLVSEDYKNATGLFKEELNLSNFAKGVYILQVQNGNIITSKKLIIK